MKGSNLRHVIAFRAFLAKADLRRANLYGGYLYGADLRLADLQDANLRESNLNLADVQSADFDDAKLQGADLREATGLKPQQLSGACGDEDTKLPPGIKIKDCDDPKVIHVCR